MAAITHTIAFVLGGSVGIVALALLIAGRDD